MKKLTIFITSFILIISGFILPTYTNAKIVKKKWCSGYKISKFGIYTLGCDLAYDKLYYPLRGKNWIYSGDTFGLVADNIMSVRKTAKRYNIKMKISVIKGVAKKVTADYDVRGYNTSKNYKNLSFKSYIDAWENSWSVWNGKFYVKSKKGCTIQIKMSQKSTTSILWNSYTIKIKVKKRPLF
jgi:hypothetical protein